MVSTKGTERKREEVSEAAVRASTASQPFLLLVFRTAFSGFISAIHIVWGTAAYKAAQGLEPTGEGKQDCSKHSRWDPCQIWVILRQLMGS